MIFRHVRRLWPVVLALVVLIVVTTANAFLVPTVAGRSASDGVELGGQVAPPFQLLDARGMTVDSSQLKGKAVALTFIYTNCPDICPATTAKFRAVSDDLGADLGKVALVAITVDPERDTPARIAEYSASMGMTNRWEFLTGARSDLAPVWAGYGIAPLSDGPTAASSAADATHTFAVYLIDPAGRERRLLDQDFTTGELTAELRGLISGSRESEAFLLAVQTIPVRP